MEYTHVSMIYVDFYLHKGIDVGTQIPLKTPHLSTDARETLAVQ